MAAETAHSVASSFETCFPRDYGCQAPDLRRLYENAKRDQWNDEFAYFRKLFRREMHTQMVTNIKRVGLLTERAVGLLRGLGIDPELANAA